MPRFWASLLMLSACTSGEHAALYDQPFDEQILGRSSSVVYEHDDRRDVYECDDERARSSARASLVALVPVERTTRSSSSGRVTLSAPPLESAYGVCESEHFSDQPTAADCSGVLIDDDLVLTAGHCFEGDDCERYAYVFDYLYTAQGELESIDFDDVFACRDLLVRSVTELNGPRVDDFAVVRLDRPVSGARKPAQLRRGPLHEGEALTVIGFPSGLPAKVDLGAIVRAARPVPNDYFSLDSDTFAGSSGSPVFDEAGRLCGVVVRGGRDYIAQPDAGCATARVIRDVPASAPWEQASYARRALEVLCERHPSLAICWTPPVCGDGLCEPDEASGGCPADCLDACRMPFCREREESLEHLTLLRDVDAGPPLEKHLAHAVDASSGGCSAGVGSTPRRADSIALTVLAWMFVRRRRAA